jgi:ketosteroid isomerase-like protein
VPEGDLEIVRHWYRAFANDADFRELTHPEMEWAPVEENHTVHRGIEGARRVVAGWSASWSDYTGKIEEVLDGGEQGIVVVLDVTARGAASGAMVDIRSYQHFRIRDGKVAYLYEYPDRGEALRAVGLDEAEMGSGG